MDASGSAPTEVSPAPGGDRESARRLEGLGGPRCEEMVDPADWEAAFGVNVFAVLRMTQAPVNAFRPGAVDTAMQGWIRDQDPAEIGAAPHERFVTGYESGSLLTPEDSAAALLDHLDAGGNGQIWDVP